MKAIALTGRENENQAIVAAQILDRLTARGRLDMSLCLGITSVEDARLIVRGGGEIWRVGPDVSAQHLDPYIDRNIDTSCSIGQLIERVDHAIGLFLAKPQVAA